MLEQICKQCNLCNFMPNSSSKPKLATNQLGHGNPRILVIDDNTAHRRHEAAVFAVEGLLAPSTENFLYTTTIRCDVDAIAPEQEKRALSRCSVWTNNLLDGVLLILATEKGLGQLKVEGKREGDVFVDERLGLVVCIPTILEMVESQLLFDTYREKVQRAIRETA